MDKNMTIKVMNRDFGRVGYQIPELGIERQFTARETKEITFGELERLSFIPGGMKMITDYLVIKNQEALEALGFKVEPEYFYTEDDIKRLMTTGTLDEFLDCLDFAPDGILEIIKNMAVTLPLNDMAKREAILEKLEFNVTRAIEIRNTKFDSGDEDGSNKTETATRRVSTPAVAAEETGRRVAPPKYKVTTVSK